jgi:hypothetical protein
MSVVVLNKIPSASKEAYFEWEITLPTGVNFKKGMLCLTDIDQDGDDDSRIQKYQLHSTESPAGAHIFEDLHVGEYYARLTIIGSDNSMNVSDLLTVTVYDLGAAKINLVVPGNSAFTITLDPYNGVLQPARGQESAQEIEKVSFVLFGRRTDAAGFVTSSGSTQNLNIVKDYNSNNTYTLTSDEGITNSWSYEIACFYTDNKTISGDISNTVVATPTNKPNQITDVEAVYDSSLQQLIIKYTNPNDISEWTPETLRATLTYGANVQLYYFSVSSNSGTDYRGQQIVFNMSSSPALTADTVFTLTLAMKSEEYGYSEIESEAITCIVPPNFCSDRTTISNVQYIVGDNEFSVTYNKQSRGTYYVTVQMVITDIDSNVKVYDVADYESGTPIYDVVNGHMYNVNLQVFYTSELGAEFGPAEADKPYHYEEFIPHGQADAPHNLQVVYGDGTATLSWDEPDCHGYVLDRYELSIDNGSTWSINNYTNEEFTITCDNGYTSGTMYPFKVRAITKSFDPEFYNGTERTTGKESGISVYPLKNPEAPVIDTQTPGDSQCAITFHDGDIFGGVKQYYSYNISNAPSGQITNTSTSYTFEGLTNGIESTISITLVTTSGPDNVRESEPVVINTTPFKMPDVPVLSAIPDTYSVKLTWSANNPDTILGFLVEYDVEYKLSSDSTWNTDNSNVSSPLTISGLTPDSEYNFQIRSKIYNSETGNPFESEYSDVITSRPFVYLNAPTMVLEAGNGTITVKLTPSNDNFYGPNKYYAEVDTDPDVTGSGIILKLSSNTSTLIFDVGNSGLVNLDLYKVTAWYDMVINEPYETTTEPYVSDFVSNSVTPFDKTIVPVLYSDPNDGEIILSWDDSNMKGLNITGYEVKSKLYTDSTWGAWEPLSLSESNKEGSNTAGIHTYHITRSHPNGTKMIYKIRAVILNAGVRYESDESREAIATPFTDASAPRLVSYVSSNQQITLNWDVPSNLEGLPLKRYEVTKDRITWISTNNTTYTFNTDLVNGQKYTFYVLAVTDNSDNMSQVSNIDTVIEVASANELRQDAIPYAVPTISIDSVVSGDRKLDLSWTQDLGGHKFDHYKIKYNSDFDDNITSTDLNYSITNLNNGTEYACVVEVYVKDENDNADQAIFSKPSDSMSNIPHVRAVAPKNLITVPSDESVRLSWASLTQTELGGLPLDRYEVKKAGDSEWISVNDDLYYDFTELRNGDEYTFYVRAVTTNYRYVSDPAISKAEVIGFESSGNNVPYLPLVAPIATAEAKETKTVTLSWSEPALVGLTLDYYEISGGSLSSSYNVGTVTTFTFNNLTANTEYSFYVKAVTSHTYQGTISSPDSEEVTKIAFITPDKVTNLSCTAVNGVLTVYFDDPSTSSINNGLDQDYKIKVVYEGFDLNSVDYETIITGGTIPIPTDSTQTIGVYVYSRIRDPNNADNNINSVYSLYKNINVVNSNLLSDIQNLTATPGDQQVTLNWENINPNSGSTYAIVRIKEDGSFERLPDVSTTTAIITNLSDGSRLVNGTLYRFNVYAAQNDMLQITATPIGLPIIGTSSKSGSDFITNIELSGDTKMYISIIAIYDNGFHFIGPDSYSSVQNTISGVVGTVYTSYVIIASNSIGSVKSELRTN